MGGGNVPAAGVGGGIGTLTQMDGGDALLGQRVGEAEIGRSVENRVGRRQQEDGVDATLFKVGGEIGDRAKAGSFGLQHLHGLTCAKTAKRTVDFNCQVANRLALTRTGDNQRAISAFLEIFAQGVDPLLLISVELRSGDTGNDLGSHRLGDNLHLTGRNAQTMIGHAAGE